MISTISSLRVLTVGALLASTALVAACGSPDKVTKTTTTEQTTSSTQAPVSSSSTTTTTRQTQ